MFIITKVPNYNEYISDSIQIENGVTSNLNNAMAYCAYNDSTSRFHGDIDPYVFCTTGYRYYAGVLPAKYVLTKYTKNRVYCFTLMGADADISLGRQDLYLTSMRIYSLDNKIPTLLKNILFKQGIADFHKNCNVCFVFSECYEVYPSIDYLQNSILREFRETFMNDIGDIRVTKAMNRVGDRFRYGVCGLPKTRYMDTNIITDSNSDLHWWDSQLYHKLVGLYQDSLRLKDPLEFLIEEELVERFSPYFPEETPWRTNRVLDHIVKNTEGLIEKQLLCRLLFSGTWVERSLEKDKYIVDLIKDSKYKAFGDTELEICTDCGFPDPLNTLKNLVESTDYTSFELEFRSRSNSNDWDKVNDCIFYNEYVGTSTNDESLVNKILEIMDDMLSTPDLNTGDIVLFKYLCDKFGYIYPDTRDNPTVTMLVILRDNYVVIKITLSEEGRDDDTFVFLYDLLLLDTISRELTFK